MANSIVTNSAANAAIRSLFNVDRETKVTQSRIESGLRVGDAASDPAVFAIAQGMRADMAGLKAVQDGQAFGLAALNVASSAATKMSETLTGLKQTITQGQQQGLDKEQMNAQVKRALENFDVYARSATYNGVNLLVNKAEGDVTDTTLNFLQDISGRRLTVSNQEATAADLQLDSLDVDAGGLRIDLSGAGTDFVDGNSLTIKTGTGSNQKTFVFEFNAAANSQASVAKLNSVSGSNTKVIAVNIGSRDSAVAPGVELGRLIDAMKSQGIGARRNSDGTMDVFGANISELSVRASKVTNSSRAVALQKSGTGSSTVWLKGQVANASAKSAAFSAGIAANSAGGKLLSVIGGKQVNSAGAAASAASAADRIGNSSSAIDTINNAIKQMASKASTLGAATVQVKGLQEFSKALMDSLKDGLGALVDADLAEESARLQSLQARQQLSVQSLSIANQQPQSLLGLFR